ncbi:MAG TPA: hypothetical protein VMS98_06295 [Thermoanaerobaculia bacterium]|nr:hypothetical protein [Thermoanaerobaculia bacterium]
MNQALVVLLESLIDYAGMYPPAALTVDQAVANYTSYRRGKHMWALGRFVVPAAQLAAVPRGFPVTVVATDEMPDTEVIEIKAGNADAIERIARARGNRTVYVEVVNLALLATIKAYRLRAKIRTGGTTAEAFPSVDSVVAFIRGCVELGVPFKATAGLHHPIRCVAALTYDAGAAEGTMHGFLNLFMASALPEHAEKILLEDNVRAFAFDDGGFWWRDLRVPTEEIARVRQDVFVSFGSCSFEEPIADLKELGWL